MARLLNEEGVDAVTEILEFMKIKGTTAEMIDQLERYRGKNELFDQGLEELNLVTTHLTGFAVPEEHFQLDLTIARGLDYYTGTVYETVLLDHPEIGSICSGGRYDNLAEYYTNKQLPGVGISIGLTRLFFVLQDQGYLNPELQTSPCQLLLLPMTEELGKAVEIATIFRSAGISTQLYTENKKFKQKMAYADKISVGFVAILGEDEIASGKIGLKNMKTGEQQQLTPEEAVVFLLEELAKGSTVTPILEK